MLSDSPSDSIVVWRTRRLLRAGFPDKLAERIAGDCAFDLHALLGLKDRGCPPYLAVRILAPLEDRRSPC